MTAPDLKAAPLTGSIADHDALCDAYDAFVRWSPAFTVPDLTRRSISLAHHATKCGWDGREDLTLWAMSRTETYRRNCASGFEYRHETVGEWKG